MTPLDIFITAFAGFYGSVILCMCCVACKNKYEQQGKLKRLKKLYTNIKYKKVHVMDTIQEEHPLCQSKIELGDYTPSQNNNITFIPDTIELGV